MKKNGMNKYIHSITTMEEFTVPITAYVLISITSLAFAYMTIMDAGAPKPSEDAPSSLDMLPKLPALSSMNPFATSSEPAVVATPLPEREGEGDKRQTSILGGKKKKSKNKRHGPRKHTRRKIEVV